MSVIHTNRKGKTYYLHQGITRKGNPKYFFTLRDEGDLVDTVPPGYEIYENPNAQVFLRRQQQPIISDEEITIVKAGMQQYSRLEHFIVDVKKNVIAIYTPDQDIDLLVGTLDFLPGTSSVKRKAVLETIVIFSPMLQFILVDKQQRLFAVQRFCFLGAIDDWMTVGDIDGLPGLVKTYVPHLGEDSFYDLY